MPHKALFSAAIKNGSDYNSLINHGYRQRSKFLTDYISKKNPLLLTDDVKFQIDFFVTAESQLIGRWMLSGAPEDIETLARRVAACVPKALRDAVGVSD